MIWAKEFRRAVTPVAISAVLVAGCSPEGKPEYAIDQLVQAVRADDGLLFDAFVDSGQMEDRDVALLKRHFASAEGAGSVRVVEDNAEVEVNLREEGLGAVIPLRVRLVRGKNHWKVSGIEGEDWQRARGDICEERLPEVNRAVQERMNRAGEIGEIFRVDRLPQGIRIIAPYTNRSDREIQGIQFRAEYTIGGETRRVGPGFLVGPDPEQPAEEAIPLKPGETQYGHLKVLRAVDRKGFRDLFHANFDDVQLKLVPSIIWYSDGEEVKTYYDCKHYMTLG